MLFKLNIFTLFFIGFLLTISTTIAEEKPPVDLQKSFDQLKTEFDKSIKNTAVNEQNLKLIDAIQKEFAALNIKLEECIANNTEKLVTAKNNLKVIGEQQNTEDRDIKIQRKELEDQAQDIDNKIKRCNLLKIQLKELSDETALKRSDSLKQKLLSKETSLISGLTKGSYQLSAFKPIIIAAKELLTWQMLVTAIIGFLFGCIWKRRNPISEIDASEHTSPTFSASLRGVRRNAPVLIPLFLIWIAFKAQPTEQSYLVDIVCFALSLSFTFAVLIGFLYPQPLSATENKIDRRKLLLFSYTSIIFSTLAFALNEQALGRFSNDTLLYFSWLSFVIIAAVCFIRALQNSIQSVFNKTSKSLYLYIPIIVLACLIVTAILGYRNLSSLLFFGVILTLKTLFFIFLVIRISSEFFDSLDQGKISWQAKLRMLMSVKSEQAFPGVIWFRILVFFAILFVGISSLISIWGGPQQPISSLKGVFQNGLNIGSLNFDVFNIVYALLIMIVALSILPFIKNKLISGWLKHSNLSSGAKDATQTLIGYVVLAIATLWALFILGMNFQNLAIIAGALSVGIGFGLQNIVNNFVSGLILLFERPIRRGDWIIVGSTEGYVREISIRSTTIQTFDRADVIVPNSELISNQVTNWMLSSNIGRLKAAVGVAYGTDVNKVMDILKQIANDHPEVISNNNAYPTRVFFLNFGDSSLDFELRCFIKDVDNMMVIRSEVNLSIYEEFNKNSIEIPFPQRVVHMNNDSVE